MKISQFLVPVLLATAVGSPAFAQDAPTPPGGVYRSSIPADQRRAFFGEMHLHTTLSFDAWTFGTKITPDEAYKFARGETVMVPIEQVQHEQGITAKNAVPAKRSWPLDFMAVTDHSEGMGVITQLDDPNNPLSKSPMGQAILKDPHKAFTLFASSARTGKVPAITTIAGPHPSRLGHRGQGGERQLPAGQIHDLHRL